MKRPFVVAFLVVFIAYRLPAQSHYSTSWTKDGWLGGGALVVAFTASEVNDALSPLTIAELAGLSRDDVNWFDRSATNFYSESVSQASDVVTLLCVAAPLALLTDRAIGNDWGPFSAMYFETFSFGAFLPLYGKGGVGRIRPYAYDPNAPLSRRLEAETRRSFFSGHTTLAFAHATMFATIYSEYYPDSNAKPYVWGASMLAASTAGILRYLSGEHFPTDILVGAAVGGAIGYIIPRLHRNYVAEKIPDTIRNSRISFAVSF